MIQKPSGNLAINNLTYQYKKFRLGPIDFSLAGGELMIIVGNNGAGKSTLFRLLGGLMRPHGGEILIDGNLVAYLNEVVSLGLDQHYYDKNETVRHCLATTCKRNGVDFDTIIPMLQDFGLDAYLSNRVGTLSLGTAKKLTIISSLSRQTGIYVLDEPNNGLDYEAVNVLYRYISRYQQAGKTILMSLHLTNGNEPVPNKVGLIRDGQMVVNDIDQANFGQADFSKMVSDFYSKTRV